MKTRIDSIDISKGICITLVVLFHSRLSHYIPGINSSLGLLRLPCFFFLSGIFFNELKKFKTVFLSRTDSLLKPYFITLFGLLFTGLLLRKEGFHPEEAKGIIYGVGDTIRITPLWFLTHLWALQLLAWLFIKTTKINLQKRYIQIVFILGLCFLGWIIISRFYNMNIKIMGSDGKMPGLPFSIDIALVSGAYFLAGRFLREEVKNFKPSAHIALPAVIGFVSIVLFTDAAIDFNKRIYHNFIFATLGATSGIYLCLCLGYAINKQGLVKKMFCYLGTGSLFILIFHGYFEYKTGVFLENLSITLPSILIAVFSFVLSILLSLIMRLIIEKVSFLSLFYLPFRINPIFLHVRYKWQKSQIRLKVE